MVVRRFALAVFLLAAVVQEALAANRYFVGDSGSDWNTTSSWSSIANGASGASIPGDGDRAEIRRSSLAFSIKSVKFDKVYADGTELNLAFVEDTGVGSYRVDQETYFIQLGDLEIPVSPVLRTQTLSVGEGARWNQSAGSTFISSNLNVGVGGASPGTYTLSGGLVQGPFFSSIGWNDNEGTINHSGGTFETFGSISLGAYGGAGTYNLSGSGTLKTSVVYVGGIENGAGIVNVTAGNHIATDIYVGYSVLMDVESGAGTYNLSGGSLTVNRLMRIGGVNKTSLVKQTGGDATIDELEIRNQGAQSPASYQLQGGTLEVGQVSNAKTFSHTGGTLRVIGAFDNTGTATFGGVQQWQTTSVLNASGSSTTTFNSNAGAASTFTMELFATSTARVNFNASQNAQRLSIADGAIAELAASPNANRFVNVRQLAIEGGPIPARIDLNNGGMIVDKTLTTLAVIRANLLRGYNGGNWNGSGIMSAFAADDPSNHSALGYFDNSAGTYATFLGQGVDDDSILVLYTMYGDANLDRKVSFTDLVTVAANFGATDAHWFMGDFNYDKQVTFTDLVVVAAKFGGEFPAAIPGASAEFNEAMRQVPEPAAVICVLAGLSLGRRGRRMG